MKRCTSGVSTPSWSRKLKERFDRYAILHVWDFQNPAQCTFHVEPHRASGGAIPAAVEKHIRENFFAPEDFETFIVDAAARGETMKQVFALLRGEPLPGTGSDSLPGRSRRVTRKCLTSLPATRSP